jgi:hypothetical protein
MIHFRESSAVPSIVNYALGTSPKFSLDPFKNVFKRWNYPKDLLDTEWQQEM